MWCSALVRYTVSFTSGSGHAPDAANSRRMAVTSAAAGSRPSLSLAIRATYNLEHPELRRIRPPA